MSDLNSNDEPRAINNPDALSDWKQTIWRDLIGLSGAAYQKKLKEAKTHWARKVKLTNDQTI